MQRGISLHESTDQGKNTRMSDLELNGQMPARSLRGCCNNHGRVRGSVVQKPPGERICASGIKFSILQQRYRKQSRVQSLTLWFILSASLQYHFAVIYDTSQLSGENDTLQFLVQAKR